MPARQGTERKHASGGKGADDGGEEPPRSRSADIPAAAAADMGLRMMSELTGKDTESVTRVEPSDDGWLVGVEIVEDRRIPSSGDTLALYEIDLDMEGELLSYRRVRRYKRGSGDPAESPR
ncbi:gas vesicle protein [Nonomuraea sp. NPDC049486]|uniref:Gas vesicle protein n=1 Tax=Nonomuraea harbinensis TaxID=1286938 RepID=A0ABW1BQH6_9ACTN|nr:gas vesicle protein [Nonomuraea harbinensis]